MYPRTQFKIITCTSTAYSFSQQVEDALNQGWILRGQPNIYIDPKTNELTYFAALLKERSDYGKD